ncbi:hypothetical protein BGP75_09305 [Motiliproteus sp. MSK22-1]|nr:hypothetical protein BGP75_09305 [Motiliproteus sp. MSK22-1]
MLLKSRQRFRVPLNASCPEGKSQKFAFSGFNNATFGRVNDQFQAVLQVVADAAKHTFASSSTFHQDRKIIGIAGELMSSFFKFLVQGVENGVSQKWG